MESRFKIYAKADSSFNFTSSYKPYGAFGEFGFEKNFDEESFFQWMDNNWTQSFYYSAVYVALVFGGKYYMQNRAAFDLRLPLALWSAILAVFSIFGAIRFIPELFHVLRYHGFDFSVCSSSYYESPTGFWIFMFAMSKVWELGDTMFIVARKQQLIFLHWYHHITTLIYAFYSYNGMVGSGRWFMTMNYVVHGFMYSYYALRALRVRIPRPISMAITSLQIVQMLVGTFVNVYVYRIKTSGGPCHATMGNLNFSLAMYASYLLLFSYFFYNAYLAPKSKFPKENGAKKAD